MRLTLAGSFVLIWSAMQLKSQVFDIWRDKKNYLPFWPMLFWGYFFSSVFFLSLCRILKCSDSNYFTVYQSSLYPLLQSLGLSQTSLKKRHFLCFGCHAGCWLDGDKGGSLSVIHDAASSYNRFELSAMGVMFNVILPQPFA